MIRLNVASQLSVALVALLCSAHQDCSSDLPSSSGCLHDRTDLELRASSAERESEDESGLLQVASTSVVYSHARVQQTVDSATTVQKSGGETCASLINHLSYASIEVGIGTPVQKFDLVVDTGSDSILVPDCRCTESGQCELSNQCFDYRKSATAGVMLVHTEEGTAILSEDLTYGSGTLSTVIGSDIVRVAGTVANMSGGIFVIEDESQLRIAGEFEGIFPLGVPMPKYVPPEPLWAEVANAPRYSLCFNAPSSEDGDGKLAVNMKSLPDPFEQIGSMHWGLGLEGISVGDVSAPVTLCDPAKKTSNMDSACGAIPDSGRTLIMGPASHILILQSAICDAWPRCREKYAGGGFLSKLNAFNELLYYCGQWMTEEEGVDEIPPINLHLAGQDGKPRTVQLSAWTYIMETESDMYVEITGKLFGKWDLDFTVPTGATMKTCTAGFGPLEWSTMKNGPVWILGTSLFYDYTVGFDISNPPYYISLSDAPCTKCENGKDQASLLQGPFRREFRKRALRFLKGPVRERRYNTSMPL